MNTPTSISATIMIINPTATPNPAIVLASLEPGRRAVMVVSPPEMGPTMKNIASGQCTFYWRIQSCHVHGFKLFLKFLVAMIEGLSFEEKSKKMEITTTAHLCLKYSALIIHLRMFFF